jgi:hypothetical protein
MESLIALLPASRLASRILDRVGIVRNPAAILRPRCLSGHREDAIQTV